MNPAEMNTSYHILQQQAALVQQQQQSDAQVTNTQPVTATTESAVSNGTSGLIPNPDPIAMDHCNKVGGFHDGMMDIMCDNEDDYMDDASELNSLEGAAFQSRLAPEKMSPDEMRAFPDIIEQNSLIPVYLYIRNSILKFWYQNPRKQILIDDVYRKLEPSFNSDPLLLTRIFHFLERNGYINFGVFEVRQELMIQKKPKIIIIGAGISGLIAARQLKYFGFDVFVLESRNRIGGRVCTYKQGKFIADVGAILITGLGGNPLRVLEKQIPMKLKRINQKCTLHFNNQPIDKTKDEIIETVFNNLLGGTTVLAHKMNFTKIGNKNLSLGEALEVVIELQERDVKQRYLKHLNDIAILEEKLGQNYDQLQLLHDCITDLYEKHRDYVQSKTARTIKQEYAYRVNRYQLNRAIENHAKAKENIKRIEEKIQELESLDIARSYLSPGDRRILDWHFANLEYATNTPMKDLSLEHWDQDDAYEFTGPQISVKNGYSCIPYALADGVDVKLNSVVRSVKVLPTGVEVNTVNIDKYNHMFDEKALSKKLSSAPATIFLADAVLCTAPLGVLKNSVQPINTEGLNPNKIDFIPPLPAEKVKAINRLGYGNLNKVVLIFDTNFWDKTVHLFGHVGQTAETRGELFLFWSLYKHPVLISYIAGDAANNLEKVSDEIIKERCLDILHGIYKQTFPTLTDLNNHLKSYYVTRWKSDPWSLGSYSYVATEATGDDYDSLAEPVFYPTGHSGQEPMGRLFFGGEHTIREYPATVHGAMLSGLREAARIANQFLGVPYLQKKI